MPFQRVPSMRSITTAFHRKNSSPVSSKIIENISGTNEHYGTARHLESLTMSNDVHWITAAISKAREQIAEVPEPVWAQIEASLRGRFSERPIPAIELASVAKQLIEGMVPAPQESKEQP